MALLAYPDPESLSAETREALEVIPDLNIFRMMAHAESAFVPYLNFGGTLLSRLELNPLLREQVILLVAQRSGAEYEWVQHVGIARSIGIPDDCIDAIQREELDSPHLSDEAAVLLGFADSVLAGPRVPDDVFMATRRAFSPRQIVETLLVVGNYLMLAKVMTTLDIEVDEAVGDDVIRKADDELSP